VNAGIRTIIVVCAVLLVGSLRLLSLFGLDRRLLLHISAGSRILGGHSTSLASDPRVHP
jgi:hypothetical protein